MATAPPPRTRRLRQLRLDPSKIAGNATPTVQDTKRPASRTNSSSSDHVDSVSLTLKLHRETDEGLGMVLGVEETVRTSGTSTTSGRSVIVKSVTAGSAAAGAVSTSSSGSDVSKTYDVSDCGFRVGDRLLRIDEFVLDDLEDDDCLTVLQDIPEVCTVVVQRTVASAGSPTSPNAWSSSSSSSTNLSSLSMTSSSPSPSSTHSSSRSPSSAPSTTTTTTTTTPSTFPRTTPRTITKEPSHSSSAATNPTTLPRTSRSSLKTTAKDGGELPSFPKPTPSSQMPRPPPRKVRRQMSTAAHLAEKGLPGFQVRRVTFRREEGQTLGLSIVPSFGATKFYYQVKRLLPTGVCAQSQRIEIGDRLLECNGQSLQNLTQVQCLDVLKAAAPKVTLTLLREIENENGDTVGVHSARAAKGKAEDAAEKVSSRVPRETEIAGAFGVQKGCYRSEQRAKNGADVNGDEHTTSSKSTQDVAVKKQLTSRNNSRYRPPSEKPGDAASSDTMSDPVLDPPASFGAGEEGGDARVEPSQKQQQHNGNPDSAGKTTPLDQDLLGGDGSGDGWSQSSMTQASNATAPDTLIDLPSGLSDSRSDGLLTEDILLDVSDTEMGEEGGQQPLTPTSSGQANGGGGLDLLCGDDAQFGESDVNIPPPMEFSDSEAGQSQPAGGSNPVTNIDDLLGMEFTAPAASPAAPDSRKARASSGSSSGSDNFDFLLDVNEAKEQGAPVMLAGIAEEEPPRRPSGPPPRPSGPPPPPPVPSGPPPPLPTDSATAEAEGESETDTAPPFKTSVFLPSENPLDNVTQISLNNDATTANSTNNNTVHVTDITVTSSNSNVSAINVMRPKPAPRGGGGGGGGGDSNEDNKASPRGSTVVTVDNSSAPTNTTQIHFDNSTNMTVVKATPPLNAFLPTSMGITKTVKPKPPKQEGEEEEEEEEEVIQPMTVHRDHQGNKLAAPSPPETLGRQSFAPKKFDEEARRDLQKILGDMEKTARPLPVRKTKYEDDDDAPSVTEDEIVPVKLTRKEAAMAEDVLSKWVTGGSKSDDSKPSSSPFSVTKKSGFHKMVGTVIDVQSGKVDLPTNSAFFTTIGVTRAPKPKMNGVEGEEAEEEAEEEITPMSVVKDHLGNKYYAPSPPESLGKKTGVRKLDSAAREDIAALLSGMSTSSSSKPVKTSHEDKDSGVAEDEIVATVLTKEESRIALDAMQKWMSEDKNQPQAKPSPFQRLVGTVIDVAAKTDDDVAAKTDDNVDANETAERKEIKEEVSRDNNESDSLVSKPVEEAVHRSETNDVSSTPPSEPEPVTAPEVSEQPPPATTSPKPSPPRVNAKPSMANRRNLFEQNNDDTEVTKPEPKSHSTRIDVGPKPTVTTLKTTELKPVPVPTQRAGLRGPVKLGSLSQASSLSTKPLAKIGTLSVAQRSGSMPSLIGSKLSRVEYGKTRTDDSPFLVEVLKGIVGLGIKVKVNGQGHVEVTEVQKNSPVDKNGNVKVGDYLLSVNTTELTGQTDGRVQQVLRLLPRGLVKLVVSTQPPSTSQGADSTGLSSPRAVGTYSQYGVRLAPQPFSPTSPDGPAPSLTATLPAKDPTPTTTSSSTPFTQPLTVSIGNEEEEEEDDEMSTRRLSKALSPRSGAQQNYLPQPNSPTSPTSPTSPPRPTPRQRGNVPTSLSTPRSDSSADESHDAGQFSPRKAEHKMTASEAVAAASRRPSGRNGDLPQPQSLSPKSAALQREEGSSSSTSSSPRVSSSVDPFLASARSPSGAMSPRDEELPVFVETAKKVSPVPTPRPKPRLSSDGKQDEQDGSLSPRQNGHESPKPATRVKEEVAEKQPEVVPEIVHAHPVTVINAAPPPAVASKPKIPPPVAPKPKRTSSMGSDKSGSSAQSDETPKDLPSPTLVASKLRDFADANAPTAKEQAQNRKVVTSAARMFEQKAAETKPVSPLTKPTKSSVSVSSFVKSFNRDPEPEAASQPGVTSRKISLGVATGGESGKPINSALLPASERRKSMPAPLSGSLQLTKPNSLSRFRDPPLSSRSASSRSDDFEAESSSVYNSVLKPRHSLASTTSLKSVIASREHQHKEGPHQAAPPTVGKDREGSEVSGVTFRPRSSLHGNPGDVTSRRANRSSWSPQTNTGEADPRSPNLIFTSSSLHHSDRSGPHSHSSSSSSPRHSAHLESTMKKFDDLLSDRHTFDSDEELPKVSNSVSLDLLKSRNAGRVAASMKASHEPSESPSTPASLPASHRADEAESYKAVPAVVLRNEEIAEPSQQGKDHAKAVESIPAVDGSKQKEEAESASREDAVTLQSQSSPSKDSHKEETPSEAEVKEKKIAVSQDKPTESSPPKAKQRTKPTVRDEEEEDAGDAYPEADAPAGPPALDIQMTADSYPDQDTEAPPVDISGPPASYSKEEAADDLAREMMFQQQASSIVQTVLANAASSLQQEEQRAEEEEEEEEEDAPPPIPDEAPPPLPGAPPPPIIMRNNAERLVAPEDMEVLPSQDARSAKSSPRSSEERTSSAETSPREDTRPTAAEHLELEVVEAVETETIPANFTLPNEQDLPGKNTDSHKQEEGQEPVNDADVMISFDSTPAGSLSLSVDTDLLGGGLPGKDRYLENAHGENPPVSDTLSQDSGVQDEDMSEDGLRFSQDDSPTSHGDFSSAMITPDEIPVSILNGSDGRVDVDVVEHVVTKSSPVPSPRASPRVTLSQASSPTSLSPRDITVVTTQDTSVVSSPRASPRDNVQIVHASLTQVSASPRCSSDHQQTEASVPRGGASTTGDQGEGKRDDSAANSAAVDNVVKDHVQSVAIDSNLDDKAVSRDRSRKDADRDTIAEPTTRNASSPRSPSRSPRKSPSPEEEETSEQEDSFSTSDTADIVSARKWCILDQSGSMFLHGASNSAVSVTKAMIRQVSSLMPDDLAKVMEAGNKDLDAAKLPKTVELRMVSARGLNGRPVSVDVTQREDYFVQVTKVHTKNCSVEEGDILMSVDGRSLRNRRPAQVHAQIEGTGPKGAMLTARGVKLPPSVVRQLEERSQEARPKTPDFDSTPTASSPTSPNPNSPTTAVEVSPGVYEVTMIKGVTGVGFCLEGGKASPKGDLPILIKRIFKGGPAEKCGQLKVKDEILAVNGVNFTVMRHYEAWNHLKFLDDGEIHLKIRRGES